MAARYSRFLRFVAQNRWITTLSLTLLALLTWGMTDTVSTEDMMASERTPPAPEMQPWILHHSPAVSLLHPPEWNVSEREAHKGVRLTSDAYPKAIIDIVPLDTALQTVEDIEDGMVRHLESNAMYEAVFMRRMLPIRLGSAVTPVVRYSSKTHDRQEKQGLLLATWTASGQPVLLNLQAHIAGEVRQHEDVCHKMLASLANQQQDLL